MNRRQCDRMVLTAGIGIGIGIGLGMLLSSRSGREMRDSL